MSSFFGLMLVRSFKAEYEAEGWWLTVVLCESDHLLQFDGKKHLACKKG